MPFIYNPMQSFTAMRLYDYSRDRDSHAFNILKPFEGSKETFSPLALYRALNTYNDQYGYVNQSLGRCIYRLYIHRDESPLGVGLFEYFSRLMAVLLPLAKAEKIGNYQSQDYQQSLKECLNLIETMYQKFSLEPVVNQCGAETVKQNGGETILSKILSEYGGRLKQQISPLKICSRSSMTLS